MERKLTVSMFGQKRLSREGGIEIVAKELCTRMVQNGCTVTCYNRSGHHVSGAEYDNKTEYEELFISCFLLLHLFMSQGFFCRPALVKWLLHRILFPIL